MEGRGGAKRLHVCAKRQQALTSDSLGRPRPENDTFGRLKQKQKMMTQQSTDVREAYSDNLQGALKYQHLTEGELLHVNN